MTIMVYQDNKLFTDLTVFTDYSGAVPMRKWHIVDGCAQLFAGTTESISWITKGTPIPDNIELANLALYATGNLEYSEGTNASTEIIILDPEVPMLFGNNALCQVARTFEKWRYTWDAPLMVEMMRAGIFDAVVELSPSDGLNYIHTINGESRLLTSYQ